MAHSTRSLAQRLKVQQLCRAARESGDLIAEVQQTVRLKRIGQAYNGLCPFHADRIPSLWVYPDGHWHCYGCPPGQNHGSILDWRRQLYGESWSEAARAILQHYGPPPEYRPRPAPDNTTEWPDASTWRHWAQIYRRAWASASLLPADQQALRDRGWDEAAAWAAHGLISMPAFADRSRWSERLGESVAHVPGFSTRDDGTWHGPSGLLIPVRWVDGTPVGAQIRVHRVQTGKYVWWSTPPNVVDDQGQLRYPDGHKAWVIPHWAWPSAQPESTWPEVIVTEGPLKAILIAESLGLPVLGLPGVSTWPTLLQLFQALGRPPERLLLALDQDRPPNPTVQRATQHLAAALRDQWSTITLGQIVWEDDQAKGFDDALMRHAAWRIEAVPSLGNVSSSEN
ncbi:CHC2 zinc finger domain-containing protein [Sulfobacillus thermosulfidooxidans]|uniref:CHC2 zinc finger domain-containing protein n=1 Tax=Sulfobacillus thermosulfidooxidans TaxID=28034 RepID=UPI0006B6910E|nr:CHC2 zinc finger domain-containing protein [Sulfobacillus thermosulfidooxidans]